MFVLRLNVRLIRQSQSHIRLRNQCKQFYCKQTKFDTQLSNQSEETSAEQKHSETTLSELAEQLKQIDAKRQEDKECDKEKKYDAIRQTNLMIMGNFEDVAVKNRQSFLNMVKLFEGRSVHRRNHVEFIYAALKNMREFGVNTDIEVYRALIEVMPKGKFIPTNMFQQEFMHYPKQQQCMTDLLEQMEENGMRMQLMAYEFFC